MPYVFLVGVIVLAIVIAFIIVGRETRVQNAQAPLAVFDTDDAVNWIADHLSESMQAQLSYDEVRRIVEWNLSFMRSRGAIANGHTPHVGGPVVVGGAETAEYVLAHSAESGLDLSAEQIHAVLDAQIAYLERIGAIGHPADPSDE